MTVNNGDAGLMVGLVAPNSPAFRAGLRAGDSILSVDSRNFRTIDEVTGYVAGLEPGRDVALIVQRDGRPTRVTARVEAWNNVYAPTATRRNAYYPPATDNVAEDIATLRSELQTLREEVRQLREALQSATPSQRPEGQPAETKPADAANPSAIERPPLQ